MSKERIAVVGSGIAGLTAAWTLSKTNRFDVTLVEKASSLGMGQYGVSAGPNKEVIDVPLRIFNRAYYPNLYNLCKELGVEARLVSHEGVFGYLNQPGYFRYRNFEYGLNTYSYVLPKLKQIPWLVKVGAEILRFKFQLAKYLSQDDSNQETLEDFFSRNRYSKAFRYEFFLPIFSTVCTCDYPTLLSYPAKIILRCAWAVMTEGNQRFIGGTRALQSRLGNEVHKVLFNHKVVDVEPFEDGIRLNFEGGEFADFDHVIIGTQANHALSMLGASYEREKSILSRFHYQQSDMIVHRDEKLMPDRKSEWAPMYYASAEGQPWPMATVWVNHLEPAFKDEQPLFQTWNPLVHPKDSLVLGKTSFERPAVSFDSLNAVSELQDLQNSNSRRLWFCGAYACHAVPLLEAGLVSTVELMKQFGVAAPDWFSPPV